ncbi:MAG TPA: Uma2 family endonuclease [Gemmatimonadaceae bacterium]|jgi:Uma2 family endonuclease
MATVTKRWTVEEVRSLPDDGQRYEVVDGELLVTPTQTWRHQDAAKQLFVCLHSYLDAHQVGDVWFAPADVEYGSATMVEPDLFVVPLVGGRRARRWEDVGRLLVAVEILSPSSARADRTVKRRLYQREGVPEYWIVDVDARLIERWRPEDERPEILADRLTWAPDGAAVPFTVDPGILRRGRRAVARHRWTTVYVAPSRRTL